MVVLYQTDTRLIHIVKKDFRKIPLSLLQKQQRFRQEFLNPYKQMD